jgi:cytochrome c-type biogenesis protein CcmH
MGLWISFAILTAMAASAILRPFWRARPTAEASPRDLEVYKQQLQEVEDEAARGLLGEAEAQAARIEVSRRILAAAGDASSPGQEKLRSALTPYVLAGLLPLIALSLYMAFGSPHLPSQPFSARLPSDHDSVEGLVARVERRLQSHPDDGMGWSVVAPVYMRMGRYAEAAEAFRNAARLLGDSADRFANLGEAVALANQGAVNDEARQAFDKALTIDAEHPKSRFWLAIAEEQAGRPAQAIAIYEKLLQRELPDNVVTVIRNRLAALQGKPAQDATPTAGGNVDAEQINRMVSGLAERLKADGSDLGGWLMLVRAYTVLGRKDDALSALNDARGRFAGNSEALGQIDALAKSLGLPS